MKYLIPVAFFLATVVSCSSGNDTNLLDAKTFQDEIAKTENAVVLDVRTEEEFNSGHLPNAVLADWTGDQFDAQISGIGKDQAVFVYCHSGNRSASAAEYMRENGYKKVKELDGGITSWMENGFQVITGAAAVPSTSRNFTLQEFNAHISKEKLVLVDVYADWCKPCHLMKPMIDRLETNHKQKLSVIRINADTDPDLIQFLRVDALPTFVVFKDGTETWRHVGTTEEKNLKEQLML